MVCWWSVREGFMERKTERARGHFLSFLWCIHDSGEQVTVMSVLLAGSKVCFRVLFFLSITPTLLVMAGHSHLMCFGQTSEAAIAMICKHNTTY